MTYFNNQVRDESNKWKKNIAQKYLLIWSISNAVSENLLVADIHTAQKLATSNPISRAIVSTVAGTDNW